MLTEQGRPISKLVAIAAGLLLVGVIAGLVIKFTSEEKKTVIPAQNPTRETPPTKN